MANLVNASAIVFSSGEEDLDGSDYDDIEDLFMNQGKLFSMNNMF